MTTERSLYVTTINNFFYGNRVALNVLTKNIQITGKTNVKDVKRLLMLTKKLVDQYA